MDYDVVEKVIIHPALLNTASPWATTLADLKALYACPYIGAITIRTSLLKGFQHDRTKHQHCFFEVGNDADAVARKSIVDIGEEDTSISEYTEQSQRVLVDDQTTTVDTGDGVAVSEGPTNRQSVTSQENSSLNTYGYSPILFSDYLGYIERLASPDVTDGGKRTPLTPPQQDRTLPKLIIVSVTGTPSEIQIAYTSLVKLSRSRHPRLRLAMEINLSCPNIENKPPPAYDANSLKEYLQGLQSCMQEQQEEDSGIVKVGVKLPPYTWRGQFDMVVDALRTVTRPVSPTANGVEGRGRGSRSKSKSILDFITSTNTLGSSLVLTSSPTSSSSSSFSNKDTKTTESNNTYTPALSSESSTGIGGLAGAAIHPLSLGNVATFAQLLKVHAETDHVFIIGAGGVEDRSGYERMRSVGADAVGLASALGRKGLKVFEDILGK